MRIEKGFSSYRTFSDSFDFEPKHIWRLEKGKSDFKLSSLIKVLEIHEISLKDFINSLDSD